MKMKQSSTRLQFKILELNFSKFKFINNVYKHVLKKTTN